MVIDSKFDVGDTVWVMIENHPVECEITGIKFDSGIIGCDGNVKGIFGESFYQDTTVSYYVIQKSKLDKDGGYQRINVEKYPKKIFQVFVTKEELVMSLLKD